MRSANRAAPSAHPASPGADGTNTRSKPDSRRMRALATPFSATPPPKQRSGRPERRRNSPAISTRISSRTSWTLAATVREPLPVLGGEVDRLVAVARRTEQVDESVRKGSPNRPVEVEIVEIEPEGAVGGARNQLANLVGHGRPSKSGKPHHLVFALVDLEAEKGGEGRIEHAERVRKADLPVEEDRGAAPRLALAGAGRQRRPFADAVGGKDGRRPCRRGQEGGRRV